MKLNSIKINNYKSVEDECLEINKIDGGYTYALIGINESGKSSILKAISLKDNMKDVTYPLDFHDTTKPVLIVFDYALFPEEVELLKTKLLEKGFTEDLLKKLIIQQVSIKTIFEPIAATSGKKELSFVLKHESIDGYTVAGQIVSKNEATQQQNNLDLNKYLKENFSNFFVDISHRVVFWVSDAKYLITNPINLDLFAANPTGVSIPLNNCFGLADISDIKSEISKIKTDSAAAYNLERKLGDKVTEHIRNKWPNHPIKISFKIDGVILNFLVEDEDVKYKAKTTAQRSDGFRQFASFLLTISAQSSNEKLSNSILLLDEPEIHLHPQGQENLRDELIKITKSSLNNIAIYATHSNYMIDKNHLDRCYRVTKENNTITKIDRLDKQTSSYSEVNYVIFDVPTNDYHNELYGYIEEHERGKLTALPKDKKWIDSRTPTQKEEVSLPKYIRHSIHHPENGYNKDVTASELKRSIEMLRKLKYG
jgi:energy-coupling factor transporter ATP-binding protein EcfA2